MSKATDRANLDVDVHLGLIDNDLESMAAQLRGIYRVASGVLLLVLSGLVAFIVDLLVGNQAAMPP